MSSEDPYPVWLLTVNSAVGAHLLSLRQSYPGKYFCCDCGKLHRSSAAAIRGQCPNYYVCIWCEGFLRNTFYNISRHDRRCVKKPKTVPAAILCACQHVTPIVIAPAPKQTWTPPVHEEDWDTDLKAEETVNLPLLHSLLSGVSRLRKYKKSSPAPRNDEWNPPTPTEDWDQELEQW